MAAPTYIRSNSESTFRDGASSLRDESELHYAGLRRKRLCALLGCLALLSLITIFVTVMNFMIITTLQMDKHGMRFLKFHDVWNPSTKSSDKVVQFGGSEIDLGEVVAMTGKVAGHTDSDMHLQGSRVESKSGRPLFSAQQPLVTIDWRIKKLSANKIVTNKVRSPVDERLNITVENISLRGNEAVRLESHRIRLQADKGSLGFNTSVDGSIHMHGKVAIGNLQREFPLSQSPALAASVDAYRVCICGGGKPRLFLVPGNKPCFATFDIC
ncbi:unnamed protein product, partial [Mesorhabditis spiculigera]